MIASVLRRTKSSAAVIGVGALLAGGIAIAAAPPAAAATTVNLAGVQATGFVGVAQALTVTAAVDSSPCGSILAPPVIIQSSTGTATTTIGTATFAQCVGSVFQYTFQWLPSSATVVYITAALDSTQSNPVRSAISPIPTTTRVTAANTVQLGQPTTVTASVTAALGSQMSPQGTIQFSIQGGANIGGPVQLNNAIPSTVQIQWTPAVVGAVNLVATYTPATVNGVVNTTCGSSCASAPDAVQVTSTGVNVFLADPPGFNVGEAATLTAVVSVVPPSGTVTFTVNGSVIAANVAVASNGQAKATWTPPAAGTYTIAAQWTGAGGVTGSSQETVTVGTAPAPSDTINLAPQGQGAWSPLGVYTLTNGTSVTFVTSTASGSPVTLTQAGPCNLNGNTLVVDQGTGQCRLTAASRGGSGYAAASVNYTINLTPGTQAPRAQPRASGRVNRGSNVLIINGRNNVTNAGQDINWHITSGARNCQLRFPNNGAVRLVAVRNGSCNVRGIAPAVPGQWSRMVINRTYRVS